jgi:hypothetical protein
MGMWVQAHFVDISEEAHPKFRPVQAKLLG